MSRINRMRAWARSRAFQSEGQAEVTSWGRYAYVLLALITVNTWAAGYTSSQANQRLQRVLSELPDSARLVGSVPRWLGLDWSGVTEPAAGLRLVVVVSDLCSACQAGRGLFAALIEDLGDAGVSHVDVIAISGREIADSLARGAEQRGVSYRVGVPNSFSAFVTVTGLKAVPFLGLLTASGELVVTARDATEPSIAHFAERSRRVLSSAPARLQ